MSSIRLAGPAGGSDRAAEARGIRAFDTALPQDWVDNVIAATGFDPFGQFVWSYDAPSSFYGAAAPVTDAGVVILAWLEAR